ncbi:MAG TPA: NAD(P)-dependent oxidoreductase [Thermoplasmata archaeon]|nr:NAD(P)-dependent oxidoreductase [Thermoplasmata archaeon]
MSQERSSAAPIGFVGLGTMGGPMAARLLAAGYPLVVTNRTRERAEPLLSAGASWAASPREVGRAASGQVVFVMVTDVRAVRAVLFGRDGVASGAGPGTLVVNTSTIAPEESRSVAERLARRAIRYLEAPVAGSRDAAARGELLILTGGSDGDLATAAPLLARIGARVEHLGPVGSAASMKLVNNLVMVATLAADAEALVLGEALGLAPGRVIDLLLAGGGESKVLAAKREAFLRRDYSVRFKLALAEKDLRLVARTAREAGVRTPIGREADRLAVEAMRAGHGEEDLAVLLEAARGRREAVRPAPVTPPTDPTPGPS